MRKRLLFLTIILCLVLVTVFAGCSIFGGKDDDSSKPNPNKVTITFDSQGGSFIEAKSGLPNNLVGKINNPTKDGVTFLLWYL